MRETTEARKLRSIRGKSQRKYGEVDLGDGVILPIKTLSVTEEAMINIFKETKIPTVTRRATAEEIEELKKTDPSFSSKVVPMIKTYDTTEDRYIDDVKELDSLKIICEVVRYIDMDAIMEDGKTLWEDLGVTKNDWVGLARWFAEDFCITSKHLEIIITEVKALKGESIFEKLTKFEKMTNVSSMKILEYVYEGVKRDVKVIEDAKELEETSEEIEIEKPIVPKKTTAKTKKK